MNYLDQIGVYQNLYINLHIFLKQQSSITEKLANTGNLIFTLTVTSGHQCLKIITVNIKQYLQAVGLLLASYKENSKFPLSPSGLERFEDH